MDQSKKMKLLPSKTTSSCSTASSYTPPNPYARDSSRRAIACVTCAKAKTRCDKALPSCARCVAKGIKCDPRSTRRTTDNNYRTIPTKKPFVAPKRFPTPGVLPSSATFPSPRSIPSSRPRSIMRAPSHIDFRTAVKMTQQAAIISGVPKLQPLPTYHSQISDACYSYSSSPEPDLSRFTPETESDGFALSRGATPQTPSDLFGHPEPLPGVDGLDYFDCQPWAAEGLVPVGLGFAGLDIAVQDWMTPTPTPEPEEMARANFFAENHHHHHLSLGYQVHDPLGASNTATHDWAFGTPPPDHNGADSSPFIDASLDSGIVMQCEWSHSQPQPQNTYVDMGLITSAPYVPKMQSVMGSAPVWEDVFVPGGVAY